MEFLEALEKANDSKESKEKIKNMTLCSALTFMDIDKDTYPKKWEINYFDQDKKLITQVTVQTDGQVIVHKEAVPFNEKLQVCSVNLGAIKIGAITALESAKEHEKKNFGQQTQKIFISLQSENDKAVWTVNFITKVLSIVTIKVDAETGKIISGKIKNILKER